MYQALPGPLATQHGAFVGNGGVGPVIGNKFRSLSTMASVTAAQRLPTAICAAVRKV